MMAQVQLEIGQRSFSVACADGEEPQLRRAAALLDQEAQVLNASAGRQPDARMLLLSGLMLADRTLELATRLEYLEQQLGEVQGRLDQAEARAQGVEQDARVASAAQAEARGALKTLERVTSRIEALADSRDG